jgi:hypothetical protein
MTISIDELREMSEFLPRENKELIKKIVAVMMTLRQMNIEDVDRMLEIHQSAIAVMPEALKPAFNGMITDFLLIKAFIEQAKAYDKTEEGEKAFESVFGEIKIGGDK